MGGDIVRANIAIYLFWQKKNKKMFLYHMSDLPVAVPLLFAALAGVDWLWLPHHHCLPPHQLVRPAPLEEAEADGEDDDHHLDREEEDDSKDDGGEIGGSEGGDGGEAAIEEEAVVGGGHKDTLGVLRHQPVRNFHVKPFKLWIKNLCGYREGSRMQQEAGTSCLACLLS